MMNGAVNSRLEAILELTIQADSQEEPIEAVIDTGFNGFLTLPPKLVEALKLRWLARQQGRLADGSLHVFDVYEAKLLWNGEPRLVEVEAADAVPLVGMALLEAHELRIGVKTGGAVSIAPLE